MKKFFRALALVLALTLVIGTIPASAASSYDIKKKRTLYVTQDSDQDPDKATARGTKTDAEGNVTKSKAKARMTYAKLVGLTKEEAKKHTISIKSENDEIVKANDETQRIRAYAIGKVKLTITIDGKVEGEVTVTSKKSSTDATIIFGHANEEGFVSETNKELSVGTEYTLTLPRAGKDTDNRKLVIKDADGNDVTANVATEVLDKDGNHIRKWTLKFANAGKYTIQGIGYQSDKYPDEISFGKILDVTVDAGTMAVEQSAYNAINLTFSDKNVTKEAADATTKSLTEGTANVTENKDVVKVYEVTKSAKGEDLTVISTFISGAALTDNVLTIVMFSDLKENGIYRVEYKDFDPVEFTACEWILDTLENTYIYTPNTDEVGGTAKLYWSAYAKGEKGQKVDITDKVEANGYIEYRDGNEKNDYTKYTVAGDMVDFYANDVTAPVIAKVTYYRNDKSTEKENPFNVIAKDTRAYAVVGYKLTDAVVSGTIFTDTKVPTICVDDGYKYLSVCIGVDVNGDGKYGTASPRNIMDDFNGDLKLDANDFLFTDNENVTLKTSNNDKLAIDENTGLTYTPKASEGKIAVYVYYKGVIVDGDPSTEAIDPIYIQVYDKRVLDHIEVTPGNTKISYSTTDSKNYIAGVTYPIDAKQADFTIKAFDQFGAAYSFVDIELEKTTNVLDGTVAGAGLGTWAKGTKVAISTGQIKFSATTESSGIKTVSFKVTAKDQLTNKTDTKTFSFTVKNTNESTVTSTIVELEAGNGYRVIGKDSAGYVVIGYYLADVDGFTNLSDAGVAARLAADSTAAVPRMYAGIYKNSTGKLVDYTISADKKYINIVKTEEVAYGGLTKVDRNSTMVVSAAHPASGAAISVTTSAIGVTLRGGDAYKYIESTSYSARAYKANNTNTKLVVVNSSAFNFSADNTWRISWNWNEAYSANSGAAAIDDALTFQIFEWADDDGDGTSTWTARGTAVKFSELGTAGLPAEKIFMSYAEKEDSVSILYLYLETTVSGHTVFLEVPVLRTVYTNWDK